MLAKVAWQQITNAPYRWSLARIKQYPRLFIHSGMYFLLDRDRGIKKALIELDWYVIFIKTLCWIASVVFFFLMTYGLWRLWMENKLAFFAVGVPILIVAVLHLPMWIEPRYFVPFTPIADIAAAYGLKACIRLYQTLRNSGDSTTHNQAPKDNSPFVRTFQAKPTATSLGGFYPVGRKI